MSLGKSTQGGSGSSSTSTFVNPTQAPYLENLYGTAQNTFNALRPGLTERANTVGRNLNQQGAGYRNALQRVAGGSNPFVRNLEALSSGDNPYLEEQITGLGGDILRQLRGSLEGVGSGFALANQYGGGRQGLREGEAITGALNEFGQQAANLRAGDLTRRADAATAGGTLQTNAAIGGNAALPTAFNLGLAPVTSQLGFLGQLGDIYGAPTLLTQSESRNRSSGRGGSIGII